MTPKIFYFIEKGLYYESNPDVIKCGWLPDTRRNGAESIKPEAGECDAYQGTTRVVKLV